MELRNKSLFLQNYGGWVNVLDSLLDQSFQEKAVAANQKFSNNCDDRLLTKCTSGDQTTNKYFLGQPLVYS